MRPPGAGIASNERLRPVVDALVALGVTAIPAIYRDEIAAEVRAELLEVDGVLVWIDPIGHGEDRTRFDEILHDLSSAGVWVSAHPDTIALIGTKDVLYRTRSLGWGSDVHRYTTLTQLQSELPRRLTDGPRVVKRQRGNAGIGVWKVEVSADRRRPITSTTPVLVHGAEHRDTDVDEMVLAAFIDICAPYRERRSRHRPTVPTTSHRGIDPHLVIDKVVGSRQSARAHRARTSAPHTGRAGRRVGSPRHGRARDRPVHRSPFDRSGARLPRSPFTRARQ